MCCPLVFELSVGIGGFVIGLGQISFFFSFFFYLKKADHCHKLQFLVRREEVRITIVITPVSSSVL